MTGWRQRRFWRQASATAVPGGFAVRLDDRPLRTPALAPLVLPTLALAEAIAAEWQGQGETVAPATMPLTRTAHSAIDTVVPQRAAVAGQIAAYAETDLLCHRAAGPRALAARQAAAWDPLLAFAAETLEAPLRVTTGVIPIAQPEASLRRLATAVQALDAFRLTALHGLVTLSGSLVLGLAALREPEAATALWPLSRIDEDWQAEQWGRDEEAEAAATARRAEFLVAARFSALCG